MDNNTNEVKDAILTYQGDAFEDINNSYRYGTKSKYNDVKDILEYISIDTTTDELFKGYNSLFTIFLCNKYQIHDQNNVNELNTKLVGKTIEDKAFNSTTRSLTMCIKYTNLFTGIVSKKYKPIICQINGKKQGIDFVKHLNNVKTVEEQEFLIKPNSKLKITDVIIDDKINCIVLNCDLK